MKSFIFFTVIFIFSAGVYADSWYAELGAGSADIGSGELERSTSVEFHVGKEISDLLALEVSYVDLGEAKPQQRFASGNGLEAETFVASALLTGEISEIFSLHTRVGIHNYTLESNSASTSGSDIQFGLGSRLSLTNALSLSVNYVIYQTEGKEFDISSVNFRFRF